MVLRPTAGHAYWAPVAAATRGFKSYALQRRILLRRENPTTGIAHGYWVLGARRSNDAWF